MGIAFGALLGACDNPPIGDGTLVVSGPSRMQQALTSTDEELCGRLKALLTFDRTDDLAPAPVDGVELMPKEGVVCTWVLAEETQLLAGTYDLVVRFVTKSAPDTCPEPVLVGMYVRRDIAFPFAEDFRSLDDGDFLSRESDENDPRLLEEEVSFNLDGDERDNLAEVAVGTDPCHMNSVPVVEVEGVPAGSVVEGTSVQITVNSSDADGIPHRIVLTISHQNGSQFPPETVTFSAFTNTNESKAIEPDPGSRPWTDQWDLAASDDLDDRPGAGFWNVDFTPDEPLVEVLSIQAVADDGYGNYLAGSQLAFVSVEQDPSADQPLLLPEGAAAPVGSLDFAEQAQPAIAHRFTVVDRDLGSVVSTFTTELQPGSFPAGMELSHQGDISVLSWSPTNAQALTPASPAVVLDLYDGTHTKQGEVALDLLVSPTLNDAPLIVEPRPQFLALPRPGFESFLVPFFVEDIDEVDVPPVCSVPEITPTGTTSCNTPFSSANCDVTGPREGPTWPLAITLVPAADYASCGINPTFTARIHVADSPPQGASNSSLSDEILVDFRTAEAVVDSVVEGGPASPNAVYIDGTIKRALVAHANSFTIVDLESPADGFLKIFDSSEACLSGHFSTPGYQSGAVDEINHRVAMLGPFIPDTPSCGSGLVIFDLQALTAARWDLDAACGSFTGGLGSVTNPVVDPATGDFYFLCEEQETSLVRFNAGNQQKVVTLSGFNAPFTQENQAAVVTAAAGTPWMVVIANDGFFFIDLSTFDDATPATTSTVTTHDVRDIDERRVDTERGDYLYIYEESSQGYLGRLDFDGAAPAVETPLQLGETRFNAIRGIVLRRPYSGEATPAPHLVASLGDDSGVTFYDAVWVDLDGWSVVRRQTLDDFDFGSRSERFWQSADRRYFLQTMFTYSPLGFYLHPWDGSASVFHSQPEFSSHIWVVEASFSGNLSLVSGEHLVVLDFPEAALNLDQ